MATPDQQEGQSPNYTIDEQGRKHWTEAGMASQEYRDMQQQAHFLMNEAGAFKGSDRKKLQHRQQLESQLGTMTPEQRRQFIATAQQAAANSPQKTRVNNWKKRIPPENYQSIADSLRNKETAAANRPDKTPVKQQERSPSHAAGNPRSKASQLGGNSQNAVTRYMKRWLIGLAITVITGTSGAMVMGISDILQIIKDTAFNGGCTSQEMSCKAAVMFDAMQTRITEIQKRIFAPPEECTGILCRFKGGGLSNNEIAAYKAAGLNPEVDEVKVGGSTRKYIKQFSYTDAEGNIKTVTSENFAEAYKGDFKFAAKMELAGTKAGAFAFRGVAAVKDLVGKLGVRRTEADVPDKAEKYRTENFGAGEEEPVQGADNKKNASQEAQDGVAKQVDNVNEKIGEVADQIKQQVQEDPSKPVNTAAAVDKLNLDSESSLEAAVTTTGEGGIVNFAKEAGQGILDYITKACMLYQIVRTVNLGAKIVRFAGLIKYAAEFSTAADAQKAGGAQAQNVSFMLSLLTTPSTAKDGTAGYTASNSNLLSYLFAGKVSLTSGLGIAVMGGIASAIASAVQSGLESLGANAETCGVVNTWWAQALLFVGGVVTTIFSGGTAAIPALIKKGALSLFMAGAFALLLHYGLPALVSYAAGTVAPDPADPRHGYVFGETLGSGMNAMTSSLSQQSGLRPLTNDEIASATNHAIKQMAFEKQIRHQGKNPFSFDSPDSITSRLALVLFPYTSSPLAQANYSNVLAIASAPLSMVGNAVNQLFNAKVGARSVSFGGEYCADNDTNDMNLATDPWCNPVYGESPATLNNPKYKPYAVAKWMIDNGHVDQNGNPQSDDFNQYLKSCINEVQPLTRDGRGLDVTDTSINTRRCVDTDEEDTMFRMYTLDQNMLDSMDASFNGTLGQSNPATTQNPAPNGTAVYYSQLEKSQNNPEWANDPYMGSTIYNAGCGPTAMAMVVSTIGNKTMYPGTWSGDQNSADSMAQYFTDHGWATAGGTSWQAMNDTPKDFGFTGKQLRDSTAHPASLSDMQAIANELIQGHLVIVAGDGGMFGSLGHFIVIKSLASGSTVDNPQFLINDPGNFLDNAGQPLAGTSSTQSWSASYMKQYITGIWAYSK